MNYSRSQVWMNGLRLHFPWIAMGILLCWPAFYNGFPLVYPDSGTYINNGFDLSPPPDRSVGYGYFIRLVTWQASLWPVVIAQGLLLSGAIWHTMRRVMGEGRNGLFLGIMLLLAGCSSLPWFVSQLMPDIFAALLILGIAQLGILARTRSDRWLGALWVFGGAIVHNSHVMVGLAMLGLLALIWLIRRPWRWAVRQTMMLAMPLMLAVLLLMANQAANGHGFRLSRTSNLFLVARLAESGLLTPYLEEVCPAAGFYYCKSGIQLPKSTDEVLWHAETSPIQALGGWEQADAAMKPIVSGYFSDWGRVMAFFQLGMQDGLLQMQRVNIGDGLQSHHWDDAPSIAIRWRIPKHIHAFMRTRQHADQLMIPPIQWLQIPLAFLSMTIILVLVSLFWRRLGRFSAWSLVMGLGWVLNAMVLATLASPVDRYQARIAWLLPLLAIWAVYGLFRRPNALIHA